MNIMKEKKTSAEKSPQHCGTFIPNAGQLDPSVKYYTSRDGSHIFFLSDRIVFDFTGLLSDGEKKYSRAALTLLFVGSNSGLKPKGVLPDAGVINFYLGNEPTLWKSNINTYQELLYKDIWPGIDLLLTNEDRELKFNWIVRPGSHPEQIVMRYSGADSLEMDEEGNLLVHHALGSMVDACPAAFQDLDSGKAAVDCSFFLNPQDVMTVGFKNGAYDETVPLSIDPAVSYATYLGGSDADSINGITVDSTGCAYFVGQTASVDFPIVTGAYQSTLAGSSDVFITKMAADGTSLIYSTYLGGTGSDRGLAIAIDPSGAAYVTGSTTSIDFPTLGAYKATLSGTQDAFVTKLSPNGRSLTYSTYLGGASGVTTGRGIGINVFGQTFIAGETSSASFPTTPGSISTVYNGGDSDGFVSLLSSGGGTLLVSTYLGGTGADSINGLALDTSDFVYVTGSTDSADFQITDGAFQTTLAGTQNAFVTKLVEDLSGLVFSTYLGGTESDGAMAVALDTNNLVCVTGTTASSDFPVTPGAHQSSYSGSGDVFLTKFSLDGGSLVFSTYLGGSGADTGNAVTFDSVGHVWVTGSTSSADFPKTPLVIDSSLTGLQDWFISMLSADAGSLLVSYYLGGKGTQEAKGIVVDAKGAVYVAGKTGSGDFPVTSGSYQTTYGGGTTDGAAIKSNFATFRNASVTIMKFVNI